MSATEVAEPAVGGNTAIRPFHVGFPERRSMTCVGGSVLLGGPSVRR